jgi:hypothetical protein
MDVKPPEPPEPPEDPEIVAARIRRRLYMGGALFFAVLSLYAGLLGVPWGIQVGMAGMAVFLVINALRVKSGTP